MTTETVETTATEHIIDEKKNELGNTSGAESVTDSEGEDSTPELDDHDAAAQQTQSQVRIYITFQD